MKKPHKPKLLKYPKRPKASASLETWERYYAKIKEIDKENKRRVSEYHRKLKEIEAAKKKKEELKRKIANHRPPKLD